VRCTLKRVITQIIKAEIKGDRVLAAADSNELAKKFGWLGSRSNLPAAYLTGLLCGYKALAAGVKKAVLDIGLQSPTKGSRIFAALKGALDAGVSVPHNDEILPGEERIQGQHIVAYAKQLASDPEAYQARFSEQLSRGLPPEQLTDHFLSVKEKIISVFKKEKAEAKVKPKRKAKSKKRSEGKS
jgi:large subunit ribosomal protein L18